MTNQFRVWCKNKNEWEKHNMLLGEDGGLYQWTSHPNDKLVRVSNGTHIVEFATGIRDKHKNMIYEGDKTSHSRHNTIGSWTFSEHYGCFMMIDTEEENRFYFSIDSDSLEIVGNIHEGVK
jgi:hypothetical protein